MRDRLIWLVCVIFLTVTLVSAQDTNEWFLAWGFEGQLITYTPDGETNVLIPENISSDHFRAWRMNDNSVLALVEYDVSKTEVLYHVTQTSATPIIIAPENVDWLADDNRLELLANSDTHAVIVEREEIPSGAALLIDLQANTATFLGFDVASFPVKPAAFSEDGLYFRYLLRDAANEETWTIRERKLETGTERVIFTIDDDPFPLVSVDPYGDQWIYRKRLATTLIDRSGEAHTTEYASPEAVIVQVFVGDHLISYPANCEADCVMEWKPLPDGEPLRFTLPESDHAVIPRPLGQIDETHLLAMTDSDSMWLLSTDDQHVQLGKWSPEFVPMLITDLVSPDGRWVLVLDDAETVDNYRVLDLQNLETVIEGSPEREYHILQITYGLGGFIVSEDLIHFQYYRTSDGQVFDLGEPPGLYWYVLADGTLLFNQYRIDDYLPLGIHRYNPDTQDYTLLVKNAVSLGIIDPTP